MDGGGCEVRAERRGLRWVGGKAQLALRKPIHLWPPPPLQESVTKHLGGRWPPKPALCVQEAADGGGRPPVLPKLGVLCVKG